jgi:hypothetical protein
MRLRKNSAAFRSLAALGAAPLPALSQPATQNVVEPYADLVELADRHL